MTSIIKLKKSSVPGKAPQSGDLEHGEVAINYADGKIHYKNSSNVIKSFMDSALTDSLIDNKIDELVATGRDVAFGKINVDSADVDYVKFNALSSPAQTPLSLFVDSAPEKGLSFIPLTNEGASDVTINIGQEHLIYAANESGATISNGKVVYISGSGGEHGHPLITLSRGDDLTSSYAAGIATQDIPNGGHGFVTQFGIVRDIDTSSFSAGQIVYVSADSAGEIVSTAPAYPNISASVGKVIISDSSAGTILVNVNVAAHENIVVTNNANISGELTAMHINTGYADFSGSAPAHQEGRVFYDSANGALAVYNDEADITLQVGQEFWVRVYNNSGSTIADGKPVYYTGQNSGHPTIALADATEEDKYNVQGLTTHTIENGSFGYVTSSGVVRGLNTAGLTAGAEFFLGLTPGTITSIAPSYPNYPMHIGHVVTADSSEGALLVSLEQWSIESFRTRGDAHVGNDLTVGGNLTVLGTQTIASQENISIGGAFTYLNSGNTIGNANTSFTGSGLDDATLKGHYIGTETNKGFYVRIDATGTPDTFEWSHDSDFTTTEATGVSIDGTEQELAFGINVEFGATTGHTLNDVWDGSASPVNVDTGFFTNRNTGATGVGYTHLGFFFDVSQEKYVVLDGYRPEPEGLIDLTDSSVSYATIVGGRFEGDVTGEVTGNASSATLLENARTIAINGDVTGTATSFNGGSNISISSQITANTIVNADINSGAAIADTKLATISTAGKVNNSSTTATNTNTNSAIVARDASGNFAAGTVTADLDGNASTATTLETSRNFSITGDATAPNVSFNGSGNTTLALTLASSGVTAGTYGSATNIPTVTVDAKGRVTSISQNAVSSVTGLDYDSANGQLTISTGNGNFTVTSTLDPFTTSDLSEGTNEYFTVARARGVIVAGEGISYDSATGVLTAGAAAAPDHDDLVGFVANEHIDHTSVNITAGTGLTGGGDISTTRTINVGAGSYVIANADDIAVDATTTNTASKVVARDASGNFAAGTVTADLSGNASTATALETSRTIALSGDVAGSTSFDGSGNVTITTTVADDSHNHTISNVDGLQTALDNKLDDSQKGANNGLAELDGSGKVPASQLPSYVDDVLEFDEEADFPGTGEVGKLYVALDTNDVYRWTGSAYVKVSDAVTSADQATRLATSRTIGLTGDVSGSASFNGTANATITAVVADNSHNHTIANVTGLQTALDGKLATGANAVSATILANSRTIGGVSFNGSANINLPGVNISGNQDTSGNASTASSLETARTISLSGDASGSVSFDGSANATLDVTVSSGGGTTWIVKTSSYTASSGDGIIADTSAGAFTVTLPASPSVGDNVLFADGGDWTINNLIIARNGSTIEGNSENLTVDIGSIQVHLIYDGSTWEVYAFTGPGVNVQNDTATNETKYITWADSDSGVYNPKVSSTKLFFNPSTGTLTSTDYNSLSDARLKDNVESLSVDYDKLNRIRPVSFDWKDTGKSAYGFIAQEVEEIMPELVNTSADYKSVSYTQLIPHLLEAIKDLKREINILKENNDANAK